MMSNVGYFSVTPDVFVVRHICVCQKNVKSGPCVDLVPLINLSAKLLDAWTDVSPSYS